MGGGEVPEGTEVQPGVETTTQKTHMKYLLSTWYKDVVEYLLTLRFPPNFDKENYCTPRLKSQKYVIDNGRLY